MKRLSFTYEMKLEFDDFISEQQFQLRCVPKDGTYQRVESVAYSVYPTDHVSWMMDGFGNLVYVGSALAKHNQFRFSVRGVVLTSSQPLKNWDYFHPIYKYETRLTKPDDDLKAFGDSLDFTTNRDYAIELMHRIYQEMTYQPGSTNIYTTAREAFAKRMGVCQDYAHIMVSILKYKHIPVRYVVGMMIGEGATHAWVEVFDNGFWFGLDPTNDKLVDDDYFILAHGRDYNDCIIDKGLFTGQCHQKQIVSVKVVELK